MPLEERPRHYFNNYTWALPLHLRRKGLAHIGDNERLRVALDRYTKGEGCHYVQGADHQHAGGRVTLGRAKQGTAAQSRARGISRLSGFI
jgi:hypothetical protein